MLKDDECTWPETSCNSCGPGKRCDGQSNPATIGISKSFKISLFIDEVCIHTNLFRMDDYVKCFLTLYNKTNVFLPHCVILDIATRNNSENQMFTMVKDSSMTTVWS